MAENDTASEDLVKLLPPELWQCIASHMDLRTWARTAAPTCKTLWSLQQLHLTCTGDETGLRWAIPRMQQLQTLQILLTTAEALDVMATAAGQCNFCSLTRLDFCCHRYSPASTSREQGARALQAILHQAPALQILRTPIADISPPLLDLVHLEIRFARPTYAALSTVLPLLEYLETLILEGTQGDDLTLHLEGLEYLDSVRLERLTPRDICLSETCKLDIFVIDAAALASTVWTPVLANLGSIIVDVREAELPDLPYIFVGAQNCSHVGFVVDTLGTAEQPAALLGGIAAGSTLRILGSKLHLRIDTRTKWREMSMAGVHELDIRLGVNSAWDSLVGTADSLEVAYRMAHGACSPEFMAAATRAQRSVVMEPFESGTGCKLVCSSLT